MQTNVTADLNIKADEIDYEMVFTAVSLQERRLSYRRPSDSSCS